MPTRGTGVVVRQTGGTRVFPGGRIGPANTTPVQQAPQRQVQQAPQRSAQPYSPPVEDSYTTLQRQRAQQPQQSFQQPQQAPAWQPPQPPPMPSAPGPSQPPLPVPQAAAPQAQDPGEGWDSIGSSAVAPGLGQRRLPMS